jgi:hypothetical protein
MYHKTILLAVLLMLGGCRDDQSANKSAVEARIEREISQRVAIVEKDLKVRQTTLHTIRIVGFALLAAGAVGGLIWLQRHRPFTPSQERPLQLPRWQDHYTVPSTRVLELPPATPPAPGIATTTPQRRWASGSHDPNPNRRNNHHETPRNR